MRKGKTERNARYSSTRDVPRPSSTITAIRRDDVGGTGNRRRGEKQAHYVYMYIFRSPPPPMERTNERPTRPLRVRRKVWGGDGRDGGEKMKCEKNGKSHNSSIHTSFFFVVMLNLLVPPPGTQSLKISGGAFRGGLPQDPPRLRHNTFNTPFFSFHVRSVWSVPPHAASTRPTENRLHSHHDEDFRRNRPPRRWRIVRVLG